jgi:penicillin-binding protein 1A
LGIALGAGTKVQSALLCLEADTGLVKAMVGGRDFEQSQFNRAIQSRRQPGSAFKPVVYAAALDKGYTPASVILDTAIVYEDKEQNYVWKPKNYSHKFYGPTLFRDALAHSRNLVTIKYSRTSVLIIQLIMRKN